MIVWGGDLRSFIDMSIDDVLVRHDYVKLTPSEAVALGATHQRRDSYDYGELYDLLRVSGESWEIVGGQVQSGVGAVALDVALTVSF